MHTHILHKQMRKNFIKIRRCDGHTSAEGGDSFVGKCHQNFGGGLAEGIWVDFSISGQGNSRRLPASVTHPIDCKAGVCGGEDAIRIPPRVYHFPIRNGRYPDGEWRVGMR